MYLHTYMNTDMIQLSANYTQFWTTVVHAPKRTLRTLEVMFDASMALMRLHKEQGLINVYACTYAQGYKNVYKCMPCLRFYIQRPRSSRYPQTLPCLLILNSSLSTYDFNLHEARVCFWTTASLHHVPVKLDKIWSFVRQV